MPVREFRFTLCTMNGRGHGIFEHDLQSLLHELQSIGYLSLMNNSLCARFSILPNIYERVLVSMGHISLRDLTHGGHWVGALRILSLEPGNLAER